MSYLVTSFLSPSSNQRTDEYGGSPENRMRFLLNMVQKTRALVGQDFPVGVKLICNEHLADGLSIEDCVEIGRALERAGVDYLSLSDGTYENQRLSVPSEDGTLLEHGEPQAFKQALGIPSRGPLYPRPVPRGRRSGRRPRGHDQPGQAAARRPRVGQQDPRRPRRRDPALRPRQLLHPAAHDRHAAALQDQSRDGSGERPLPPPAQAEDERACHPEGGERHPGSRVSGTPSTSSPIDHAY